MGATTLITLEPEVWEQMQLMHKESCTMVKELTSQVKVLKAKKWLDIEEAAAKTIYSSHTLRRRKSEIGFKEDEGKLIFLDSDVEAWMARGYNPPKPLPTHKK